MSVAQLSNYGLQVISPIILVHLLTVSDFGQYREFLVYGTLLNAFASFSINDSLLYFVARHPDSAWRVVRRTAMLVACTSLAAALLMIGLDMALGGALVGAYRTPLALYVLFFANLDFWESFLLARNQLGPTFAYTTGRLLARVLVVIAVAMSTTDIRTIIWSLVALEAARLVISASVWQFARRDRSEPPVPDLGREQLRFCVPAGMGVLLNVANRSLGNLWVTKLLGPAALAQFTIGAYGEPIVSSLRNAISTVLLPEMVRRNASAGTDPLALWQRTTVVNCILLFPICVLVLRYAEPLIVTVFGAKFRPAIPLLQIYTLIIVRSCFDFAPPLRAANKTAPIMLSNLASIIANAIGLAFLIPSMGLEGAMIALTSASFVDAAYLCDSTRRLYKVPLAHLLPWGAIVKVVLAAATAVVVILSPAWTRVLGPAGMIPAGMVYLGAFTVLLRVSGVDEGRVLLQRLATSARRAAGFIRARRQDGK